MSGNRRPLPFILTVTLVLVTLGVAPGHGEDIQLLPQGPAELLPQGTLGVVLAPAFDQLASDVQDVVALFDADASRDVDLEGLVEKALQGFGTYVRTAGPVVLAVALPPDGPAAPTFTLIGPAADPSVDIEEMLAKTGMAGATVQGDFLALSTDPSYAPSPERLTILDDMPAGDVSLRIDLQTLVETLGPMLKALIGMGMASAAADTTREFSIGTDQQADISRLLSDLLDSAKTLELALDYNGEMLVVHSRFETLAGSVLAPGPQPPLGEALELARLLPREHSIFAATSVNLESVMQFYREAMGVVMDVSTADLPGGIGEFYGSFFEKFFEHLNLLMDPNAMSVGFKGGAPEMAGLVRTEGVGESWDDLLGFLTQLSADSEDFNVERHPLQVPGGWEAERIEFAIDLSDVMDDADEDTAMMMGILQALIPNLYQAHRGDLGVWMATSDPEGFLDFVAGVDADQLPKLPPSLEAALEWAGDGTQSVYSLEARGLIDSAFDLLRGFIEIPLADTPPVRVDGALRIDRSSYIGVLRVDLEDAAALIKELMDVFQRFDEGSEGEDEMEEAAVTPAPGGRPSGSLTVDEAAAMAAELRPAIEEIRGHSFSQDVGVSVVNDAEAREYFHERLVSELPEAMLENYAAAYADLGMLDENVSILDSILGLLEEQAGGYYDPTSKRFYMLDDMPRSSAPVIMVHELTHALDDQVFGLEKGLDEVKHDNDRLSARGCVIEGSGMLAMTQWLTKAVMEGRVAPDAMAELSQSQAGQAEKLRNAPPVIANSLTTPYLVGQRFLSRGELWAAVSGVPPEDIDRAFENPPASMEQVLHPEKYWSEEDFDAPSTVELPDLDRRLDRQFRPRYCGVLGELDLASLTGWRLDLEDPSALLRAEFSTPAARGWDGDRFCVYGAGDRTVTAVGIVFDSEEDAQEFANAVELPAGSQIAVSADRVALVCGDANAMEDGTARYLVTEMRVKQ